MMTFMCSTEILTMTLNNRSEEISAGYVYSFLQSWISFGVLTEIGTGLSLFARANLY